MPPGLAERVEHLLGRQQERRRQGPGRAAWGHGGQGGRHRGGVGRLTSTSPPVSGAPKQRDDLEARHATATSSTGSERSASVAAMTDPTSRRAVAELYSGRGWPAHGDELLQQSLGPRSPDMLLEAPGWLGLGAGQLVLDAGCRDASHAAALTRRYGCRVVGVDLVLAGLPKGGSDHTAAGTAGPVVSVQGDLQALPLADGAVDLVWCRDTVPAASAAVSQR